MKRLTAVMLSMLLLMVGQNVALGQSPAGPTTVVKSTFPVADPPPQFQLIEQVVDFPPGSWTPPHSHGGQAFVTIAQGTVSQFSDGKDTTYQKGSTWTETPGHAHQAGNTASGPARDLAVFLLPPGAQQTISGQMANAHDTSIKTQSKPYKFD
ncbi:MAG: cupin domain-containing protein, partial [Rudaea sp.]